jgi:PAS domain S-box-containing protein
MMTQIRNSFSYGIIVLMFLGVILLGIPLQKELDKSRAIQRDYDLSMRASSVGLWVWNVSGDDVNIKDHVWCSDQFLDILGIPKTEEVTTLGQLLEKVHSEDEQHVLKALSDFVKTGSSKVYSFQCRLQDSHGEYKWCLVQGTGEFEGSKCVKVAGSTQFLGPMVEGSLRSDFLLTMAPLAIITCDERGNITRYNKTAEIIFGWTDKEMIGGPVDRLITTGYQKGHDLKMHEAVARLKSNPTRMGWESGKGLMAAKARTKSGEVIDIAITISGTNIGGKIEFVAFIVSARDIKPALQEAPEATSEVIKSLSTGDGMKKAPVD